MLSRFGVFHRGSDDQRSAASRAHPASLRYCITASPRSSRSSPRQPPPPPPRPPPLEGRARPARPDRAGLITCRELSGAHLTEIHS
jgi:hypothetical protein